MILLGGGPIAIEMAQAFQRLGTRVFVIQRSAQILSKEDKDMADLVMEVLSKEGVKFYLNVSALSAILLWIPKLSHGPWQQQGAKSYHGQHRSID